MRAYQGSGQTEVVGREEGRWRRKEKGRDGDNEGGGKIDGEKWRGGGRDTKREGGRERGRKRRRKGSDQERLLETGRRGKAEREGEEREGEGGREREGEGEGEEESN